MIGYLRSQAAYLTRSPGGYRRPDRGLFGTWRPDPTLYCSYTFPALAQSFRRLLLAVRLPAVLAYETALLSARHKADRSAFLANGDEPYKIPFRCLVNFLPSHSPDSIACRAFYPGRRA